MRQIFRTKSINRWWRSPRTRRDLPIGIVGTLVACAVLYVSVAVVLTGIMNWRELGHMSPGRVTELRLPSLHTHRIMADGGPPLGRSL